MCTRYVRHYPRKWETIVVQKRQDPYPQVDCTRGRKTDTNQINTTYTQIQNLQTMSQYYEGKGQNILRKTNIVEWRLQDEAVI